MKLHSRPIAWIVLITLVHCFIWIGYYGQTPLGESPALDNRQTLLLANQIANSSLPPETFHRAPLYPYLLSLFLSVGFSDEFLPLIARWLNAFALAIIAASSASIAGKIWKRRRAMWITGLLVGLNPVLLFFSGDAFDIIIATAAFCLALHQFVTWLSDPRPKRSLLIGLTLAIGAALRSHLLPLALLWPLAAGLLSKSKRSTHIWLAALGPLLGFLLLGAVNYQVAAEFRILPWQGAYNMWAGNGPQANGRIYAQSIRVDFKSDYDNPAKLESIALYEAETGNTPPHAVSEMNHHWQNKALEYILNNPGQWTGLMFRKAYYFLNNYEQYDNKTYSFHQRLHTQLRVNPLHWGALLLLAVAATLCGLREPRDRRIMTSFIVIFAVYAAGTILFYTSNRFRVPMIPVISILAAGVTTLPTVWKNSNWRWKAVCLLCLLATAGITYSNFYNAQNTNTWEEDNALLANASLRAGDDLAAITWAQQALALNPIRSDMPSVIVQAHFNQWATTQTPNSLTQVQVQALLSEATAASVKDPSLRPIVGIYNWKLGQTETAVKIWKASLTNEPWAWLCLFWVSASPAPSDSEMALYGSHKDLILLKEVIPLKSEITNHPLQQVLDTLFQSCTGAPQKHDP